MWPPGVPADCRPHSRTSTQRHKTLPWRKTVGGSVGSQSGRISGHVLGHKLHTDLLFLTWQQQRRLLAPTHTSENFSLRTQWFMAAHAEVKRTQPLVPSLIQTVKMSSYINVKAKCADPRAQMSVPAYGAGSSALPAPPHPSGFPLHLIRRQQPGDWGVRAPRLPCGQTPVCSGTVSFLQSWFLKNPEGRLGSSVG